MLLRIYHETEYHYPAPVSDSYLEARLRPWSDADQGCAEYSLTITPSTRLHCCRTPFAWVDFFNLLAPHDTLRLVSKATVITMPRNPFERLDMSRDDWPALRDEAFRGQFWEYLQPPEEPEVAAEADRLTTGLLRSRAHGAEDGAGVGAFLLELARRVHAEYAYDPRATDVTTSLSDVIVLRRGVCQDFAHLMLAVTRSAGIPARYVSGYHHSEPPPEGNGAMHAWVEAYLPSSGWVGFDPTHGLLADHHYVKVAFGRDYDDVPPTRGIFRGPREHTIAVRVWVTAEEGDSGVQGAPPRSGGPGRSSVQAFRPGTREAGEGVQVGQLGDAGHRAELPPDTRTPERLNA